MNAAVLRSIPGRLGIEDVVVDTPGPREVLVRTVAAGVCRSDHHYLVGHHTTPLPTVMGHEASGIVEAVGEEVTYVVPGDHVVACLMVFCGRCASCLSGRMPLCLQEGTARDGGRPRLSRLGEAIHPYWGVGAFAEIMLMHEHAVTRIDRDIPLLSAATVGCAVITGLGSVFNTAGVRPGASVAVIGAGGVGLNVIQASAVAGASRIVAIDVLPDKADPARQFGATDVIISRDPVDELVEITDGGVEYAFDAIGHKTTAEHAFAALRPGGTAVLIGMIPMGVEISLPGADFLYEKTVKGSNMGSTRTRVDIPRYLELYRRGRIKLDELVGRTRPLDEIGVAMDDIERGTVARTVITFDGKA
ncbi:MAG: Zn-dependent alcohol dehydrogenase [bacterium]|nr:Zn-dependent alcohol dehydrogenase [bacterium]MDE0289928.1 Zn-dependent alcohol dehydrogenase [bacterium]MDE0439739.1 Zn-dependent alcohol dehydrogenase [bacterium]